jgi:hypothetical protein
MVSQCSSEGRQNNNGDYLTAGVNGKVESIQNLSVAHQQWDFSH